MALPNSQFSELFSQSYSFLLLGYIYSVLILSILFLSTTYLELTKPINGSYFVNNFF